MVEKKNIFENFPSDISEEVIEILQSNDEVTIERIVSKGHFTPEDEWYDQETDEFVILLSGSAILTFEEGDISLNPGDHLFIPAHKKHRVKKTDSDVESVWLAVHIKH